MSAAVDDNILTLDDTLRHDLRIDAWFAAGIGPHRLMVREWFDRMRACGDDVREIFHDGCPVACVGEAPFAYVNAFKAHAAVGFFRGAELPDPARLLEGSGKHMRHMKLRPGNPFDADALRSLIVAAYADINRRVARPASR